MKGRSYWRARYEALDLSYARLLEELQREQARNTELQDRALASSLAELKASRGEGGFAMPSNEDVDDNEIWATGPFGHDPVKLPPLTEAEEAYAREQGFIA